jgi:putative NIF3 family GTP cyclohydrolase 1 type 2
LRKAHSYEEPAYDVYPLQPARSSLGEGRVGRLPRATLLDKLARTVKTSLGTGKVQVVGEADRSVERVAIVCGAGGEMLSDVFRARADVFLTGELRFHDYLSAQAQGLALCLPGHYATERFGIEELATRLQEKFSELQVWASRRERDPVHWV